MRRTATCFAALLAASPLAAEFPEIVAAEAVRGGEGWRVSVTLRHPDTGWDHYADGWQVLAPDGTVLGTRVLHHSHVEEQPFTRSLSGVAVPEGVRRLRIRARCSRDGWGGAEMTLSLGD
jgi:hypothetical protein